MGYCCADPENIAMPRMDPNEKSPQLVFKCGTESGCALVAAKISDGRGWSYTEPKLKATEQARIAVVSFARSWLSNRSREIHPKSGGPC